MEFSIHDATINVWCLVLKKKNIDILINCIIAQVFENAYLNHNLMV